MFYKLKWFFNQRRIIWHQVLTLYGKKIKSLIYVKNQAKLVFGLRFFKSLAFLELRLNILVLRMRFALKLIESNILIDKGFILVNGFKKTKNYIVRVNDIIKRDFLYYSLAKKKLISVCDTRRKSVLRIESLFFKWERFLPLWKVLIGNRVRRRKWRKWRWRKWFRKSRRAQKKLKIASVFNITKQNLFINYVEVNYKLFIGILIAKPKVGEVLLANKKAMISLKVLRKIYLLY